MTTLEVAIRRIHADLTTARVARTGHLIALKVLSRDDVGRPQDAGDLRALLRVASPDELERARKAVDLIVARGFRRKRDLVAELQRQVHETR